MEGLRFRASDLQLGISKLRTQISQSGGLRRHGNLLLDLPLVKVLPSIFQKEGLRDPKDIQENWIMTLLCRFDMRIVLRNVHVLKEKTIHVADSSVKDMTQLQSKKASTNSGDIWIQALCVKGCLQTYENYRGI